MNIIKRNFKVIISFILGGIVFGGLVIYATVYCNASQVQYTSNKSVENALDDLYNKSVNKGLLNWNPTTETTYTVEPGYYSGGTLSSEGVTGEGKHWYKTQKIITSTNNTTITCGFNPSKLFMSFSDGSGRQYAGWRDGTSFHVIKLSVDPLKREDWGQYVIYSDTGFTIQHNSEWTGGVFDIMAIE